MILLSYMSKLLTSANRRHGLHLPPAAGQAPFPAHTSEGTLPRVEHSVLSLDLFKSPRALCYRFMHA